MVVEEDMVVVGDGRGEGCGVQEAGFEGLGRAKGC